MAARLQGRCGLRHSTLKPSHHLTHFDTVGHARCDLDDGDGGVGAVQGLVAGGHVASDGTDAVVAVDEDHVDGEVDVDVVDADVALGQEGQKQSLVWLQWCPACEPLAAGGFGDGDLGANGHDDGAIVVADDDVAGVADASDASGGEGGGGGDDGLHSEAKKAKRSARSASSRSL